MYYLRLIKGFIRASVLNEMAYRSNFLVSALHSALNLVTGVLGLLVLFSQVEALRGWDFPSALAVLGVFMALSALRGLFIGPSLDALAGLGGEIWTGNLDFTLLRPADVQFQASFRHWRLLTVIDLTLAIVVLGLATTQINQALTIARMLSFVVALVVGAIIQYAILLGFTALVFWSPGFLFTWLFDGLFQLARYPVGMYPGWLRLALTWVIPVGVMTTIPAQALSGTLSARVLAFSSVFSIVLFIGASALFRLGLRRYASASS